MFYLQTILIPGAVLFTLYLTWFVLRGCRSLAIELKPWAKISIGLGVAAVVTVCTVFLGVGTILLLHIVVVDLLFLPFGLLFKNRPRMKQFWRSGVLAILLATLIVGYGHINMYNIRRTDYTLYTDKNIPQEGYEVVLIADVHYGVSLNDGQLQAVCDRISADDTDLVILCGDIVDEHTSFDQMQSVFRILGSIESRYGVFYIYGNHDRQLPGSTHQFTPEQLEQAILGSGITIVRDEALPIAEGLVLVGREDTGYKDFPTDRKSAQELVAAAQPEDFLLFAEHKPISYEENAASGADLILSGHTHGGQMWPIDLFMAITGANDNIYGWMQYTDSTVGIVTSGLACWGFDVKNAAPSEYVVVTILPE